VEIRVYSKPSRLTSSDDDKRADGGENVGLEADGRLCSFILEVEKILKENFRNRETIVRNHENGSFQGRDCSRHVSSDRNKTTDKALAQPKLLDTEICRLIVVLTCLMLLSGTKLGSQAWSV
jgi:hypothetical protein